MQRVAKTLGLGALCGVSVISFGAIKPEKNEDLLQPQYKPPQPRPFQLKRLKNELFDVVVIGGGATGSGVAVEAASRGLKVALIDKSDFSSETSSKSTKLVHGGVRYLEKAVMNLDYGQYKLVKEALHERKSILQIAPHLASSLPIITPTYSLMETGYLFSGLILYDLIAGSYRWNAHSSPGILPRSYLLSAPQALNIYPDLRKDHLRGAVVYHDGQMNDARMGVTLALTAAAQDAAVANYVEVVGAEKDQERDMITGVRCVDRQTNQNFVIRGKMFVNAAGPFVDDVRRIVDPDASPMILGASGTHIVLPRDYAPQKHMGMLIPKTEDGRVVFVIPWMGRVIAGTTDAPMEITSNPSPPREDIDYILRYVNRYISKPATKSDVLSAWNGIRPLVKPPGSESTSAVLRDFHVDVDLQRRMATVAGGKWTVYRAMGKALMDSILDADQKREVFGSQSPFYSLTSKTDRMPLLGAVHYRQNLDTEIKRDYNVDYDIAQHLSSQYGDQCRKVLEIGHEHNLMNRLSPNFPYLEAEIRYAVEHELAASPQDVLCRRTRLAFLDTQEALRVLPRVNHVMGDMLGWNGEERQRKENVARDYLRQMSNANEFLN
eukprot:gb/GECH01014704.1/.p1 GENE.gb/GECH01014704.1/~~gb/GECH01014704.1/.p1  ORF type:complete len:607 (+),score=161.08 gb/GECH01014704.1/:1-1821(+)